jgi:hypothetical protein
MRRIAAACARQYGFGARGTMTACTRSPRWVGDAKLTGRLTDDAVRHINAARKLNPNFATATGLVGFALALDGRSEDALHQFERTLSISSSDPFNRFCRRTAVAHYLNGHFADAVKWSRQAVNCGKAMSARLRR